jgi:hypothetical protein
MALIITAPTTSTTVPTTTSSTSTTTPTPATTGAETGSALPWATLIAALALLVSLWSAYSSYRSRQAAQRSAGLSEQRRREEQAPHIEYISAQEAPTEAIRIVNGAALSYTSVRFTIVPPQDEPWPAEALMVDYYDPDPDVGFQQQWVEAGQAWDLGSFAPGQSQTLAFRRPRLNEPGGPYWPTTAGTLRLLLDCTTTTYTVSLIATCNIPPKPEGPWAGWDESSSGNLIRRV